MARIVVVGAGVIGTAIAWRAACGGHQVTMLDPRPGRGASWVAGGMLAPVTEAWLGENDVLELGARAVAKWPEFAARLSAAGHDPGLRAEGTVLAVVDGADHAELDRVATYLAGLGREVNLLTSRELRRLEPVLGPAVRAGLFAPGDLAVDNRRLLAALQALAAEHGVAHRTVAAARVARGMVELVDGTTVFADTVVVAAGAWSGSLHPMLRDAVRPVKGEILRLRRRVGSLPPPTRTVRGWVAGRHAYLVPRDDGGLVLGATEYEAGFDDEPRAAGVRELLADAELLMPGIADYALMEVTAGVRPGSVDNLPIIGWLEPGVLAATGHGRNGLLLLPTTVDTVLALLSGEPDRRMR